jgi:RNA 3'-phosphate cyclase
MIEIQGDMLEGGGQILRLSTAISAVAKKPIRIVNVRAKRSPPGLRAQHLNAVKAIGLLTAAKIEGLNIGSHQITFEPGPTLGGRFGVDVGTAGSTSLVLQALMPVMAFSPEKVSLEITGGTNNPKAPAIEYLQNILLPTIGRMGYHGSIELVRRGFYPRGQGLVRANSASIEGLHPVTLTEFGSVTKIWGVSYSCRLPQHIVERMARSAQKRLAQEGYDAAVELDGLKENDSRCSVDQGCGLILFASLSSGGRLGGDALGRLGKPAEKVGEEAALNLLDSIRRLAPVDKHLGDQLIIYASLADGKSRIRISELTLHTLTCIEVCKTLLGVGFDVEGKLGETAEISCNGSGPAGNSCVNNCASDTSASSIAPRQSSYS